MNQTPSPIENIRALLEAKGAPLTFAEFMHAALYHSETGYYRQNRDRIGCHQGRDFYTATSVGNVFADLVAAACETLLAPESPRRYSLVEIGAEQGKSLWSGHSHPFGEVFPVSIGEEPKIPPRSIVFSNELLDAQPFHRLRFHKGAWRELGVGLEEDSFTEVLLSELSPPVASQAARFPVEAEEGYHLDLPIGSVSLLQSIVDLPWSGLFLAFDYGKSWRELTEFCPRGTLRAYHRHRQSTDLLARPGGQDLTGHICWDWMSEILETFSFEQISVLSQESFLIQNAAKEIERIIGHKPGEWDPNRQSLHELLNPAHMGQKFQVLSAIRK